MRSSHADHLTIAWIAPVCSLLRLLQQDAIQDMTTNFSSHESL